MKTISRWSQMNIKFFLQVSVYTCSDFNVQSSFLEINQKKLTSALDVTVSFRIESYNT